MEEVEVVAINKRSIQSIFALIFRQSFLQALSFISSIFVFTFLSNSQIGMYAVVIAMQRIISFVTDYGFGPALIQKKEAIENEDLKTVFTIQFVVTIFLLTVVYFFKNSIRFSLNLSEEAITLLIILMLTIFFSSFKVIPSLLLERSIKFSKLVIPQMIESLSFNVLLIILLIKGQGLSSYSYAFFLSSLIGIPAYYIVSPWKIGFGIYRKTFKHLRFGIQFQAKNILATVKDDLLTVFLAKLLIFEQISYIGFAQRWSFFVYRYIVDSVTKVTFSAYSRIQDNTEVLKKAIEKSLFFISVAMFPSIFGLIVTMPYIIDYFPKWHNKWEPAIVSVIFFSLNALVSSFSGVLVNILDSTGRVRMTLKLMVIWTSLTWILTPILIYFFGFNGVSIASFVITLTIFITVYYVKQIVEFSLIKSIYKPLLSALIMVIAVFFFEKSFVNDMLTLILAIIAGGVVYVFALYGFVGKELNSDIKKIFVRA